MISPVIICNGVIRSGSTWSFNVCRHLADLLARRRSQQYGMACLTDRSLDQFLQVSVNSGAGPVVVKVHEIGPIALQWIRARRAKAVCTFRDPRDCVASDIVFWGDGFDASVQRVATSLKVLQASYKDDGSTLLVRYEEMMSDTHLQIRRIAEYLNVEVNQGDIERIDAQTNLQTSRAICEGLSERPDNETDMGSTGHRRHRITLLHDNHIGNAKAGRWKDELTDEQGQLVTQLFQQDLQAMGYENPASASTSHPNLTQPEDGPATTDPAQPFIL